MVMWQCGGVVLNWVPSLLAPSLPLSLPYSLSPFSFLCTPGGLCTPLKNPHPWRAMRKRPHPWRALWQKVYPGGALHLCTPGWALHAPSMKLAMDGSVWFAILAAGYWPRGLDPRWPASPGLGLFPASGWWQPPLGHRTTGAGGPVVIAESAHTGLSRSGIVWCGGRQCPPKRAFCTRSPWYPPGGYPLNARTPCRGEWA